MPLDVPQIGRPRTSRLLAAFRRRLRTSELWLIVFAVAIGTAAGLLSALQSQIAHGVQVLLYGIGAGDRLSAESSIPWAKLLWLPAGGLALGVVGWILARRRPTPLVDVVEANALYGGRLSVVDSAIVCGQTLLSNGVGASVGLEAAYAQAGGAAASFSARRLKLRRHDMRILVGAGAGAAISAAFGAPLTGAFYAFEIVIGSYTPSAIAPVAAACLAAVLSAATIGGTAYSIHIPSVASPTAIGYLLYAFLGLICAAVGVAIMLVVGWVERMVRGSRLPPLLRPAIGGVLLMGLGLITPQALSAGHGALHLNLAVGVPLTILAAVLVLKIAASAISLGFGFRGGLFFASLFLGTLVGQLFAGGLEVLDFGPRVSPENAALVGMGALAVSVVGGPLTMSFLVLESTRQFGVAAATLAAALVASAVVRERFGYSFSTWRLHLRGETIRSARDVGWIRTLTAGRMMRSAKTLSSDATIAEFRRRYPLGSTSRVVLVDTAGRYVGIVVTAQAYAESLSPDALAESVAISQEASLSPEMDIEAVMRAFDETETEELAVVDAEAQVLGVVGEAYVIRRYANELERQHMELYGEDR